MEVQVAREATAAMLHTGALQETEALVRLPMACLPAHGTHLARSQHAPALPGHWNSQRLLAATSLLAGGAGGAGGDAKGTAASAGDGGQGGSGGGGGDAAGAGAVAGNGGDGKCCLACTGPAGERARLDP